MKTRAMRRKEEEEAKEREPSETDTSKAGPPETSPLLLYVCVYCATSCACLYRQLNKKSLSSIKVMHCQNCHKVVDPYIEREGLLVLIDCILLRPEAYRHVLYNHQDLACYVRLQNANEEKSDSKFAARIQRLIQWTLLSSLLHAYLKWQALLHKHQYQQEVLYGVSVPFSKIADPESSTLLYATLMITSLLDLGAQWLAIYGFLTLLTMISESKSAKTQPPPSHSIASQIYLGLLLPTSFQVVCVLVLLWENSKTSTALGSLLIAFWQCLAILILSLHSRSGEGSSSSSSNNKRIRFLKACTPVVGILSLVTWRFGMGQFLSWTQNAELQRLGGTMPCVGFEVDLLELVSMFTKKDLSRSFYWMSSPLPLCLT